MEKVLDSLISNRESLEQRLQEIALAYFRHKRVKKCKSSKSLNASTENIPFLFYLLNVEHCTAVEIGCADLDLSISIYTELLRS